MQVFGGVSAEKGTVSAPKATRVKREEGGAPT